MHIFISYAKKDTRNLAEKLANQLNQLPNTKAWWDSSLKAGLHWDSQIQTQIDNADIMVVLLSQDVNRKAEPRSFVIKEIQYAQNKKKHIIPILVDKTDVPLILIDVQYVDVTTIHPLEAQVATIIQHITGTSTSIPTQTQRLYLKLNEPWAIILAAIIGGIFVIIGAIITTSGGGNENHSSSGGISSPTISLPPVTFEQEITVLPSTISSPTETLTSIPSPKDTNTPILIPTLASTITQTSAPTSTNTATGTPTRTATAFTQGFETFPIIESNPAINVIRAYVPTGEYTDADGTNPDAFWIDVYEVTNAQYLEFVRAKGFQSSSEGDYIDVNAPASGIEITSSTVTVRAGAEQLPVVEVSWIGANAYCDWIGGRLPTATEFYKASVWNPTTGAISIYPWGDNLDINSANVDAARVRPVGDFSKYTSPTGVQDVLGNVWEWVSNARGVNHFYMGGAYNTSWRDVSLTTLQQSTATNHLPNLGFRCAYDIE